jgi:prepilin-type N-terminal cleavage/methylation domain-containing protein
MAVERHSLGELMVHAHSPTPRSSSEGFSLIEVIISTAILATGLLTLGGYMAYGLAYVSGSSFAVLAREKAREAVESVHTARDTGRLTWAKIQNESKTGGVFKDGFTDLTTPGADGLVNTSDDGAVEELRTPGADGILGNTDDTRQSLTNFKREISITDLMLDGTTTINPNLRQITVTIKYTVQGIERSYTITTYVSSYS